MWEKIVLLSLLPCVFIQKYLHVAGLDLGLDLELASGSWFDLDLVLGFRVFVSVVASVFWLASFNVTDLSSQQYAESMLFLFVFICHTMC